MKTEQAQVDQRIKYMYFITKSIHKVKTEPKSKRKYGDSFSSLFSIIHI